MTVDNQDNNVRISRNIVFLYIRMIVVIFISLYTSRVVLDVLGVSDFGIYNVVAGVVNMLGFVQISLSGASSRFLSHALGVNDKVMLRNTYSSILTVHYILAIIIVIFAETLGLWFVKEKIVFPSDRLYAVLWVYQTTIISTIMFIVSIPSIALLVAYEKMKALALFSIVEAVLKLLFIIFLYFLPFDKLIAYTILVAILKIVIRIYYSIYCSKHISDVKFSFTFNKAILTKLSSFIGWSTCGSLATAGIGQGISILLNLFFGPVINASQAIAVQVNAAMMQIFSNFQQALRPQITKSYVQNNLSYMHTLLLTGSRISIYLMCIVAVPIIFQIDYILKLWLGTVPEYSHIFIIIYVIGCFILSLKNITNIAIQATGFIRKYQLVESLILLLVLPVSYILLRFFSVSPYMVVVIYFVLETFAQIFRINITYPLIDMPIKCFYINIVFRVLPVLCLIFLVSTIYNKFFFTTNFQTFVQGTIFYLLVSVFITYILGMTSKERRLILKMIKRR